MKKIPIDRLKFAQNLCKGKRVLDIGGALMPGSSEEHKFVKQYRQIQKGSSKYTVVDYQKKPGVDVILNFNKKESARALNSVIDFYKPEVILVMETLEHITYHAEVMEALANSIEKYGTEVFITIPNNGNWILTSIKSWRACHQLAFFKDVAYNFISNSELGKFNFEQIPCFGKYFWWWWIMWLGSFCQPISWGFLIKK